MYHFSRFAFLRHTKFGCFLALILSCILASSCSVFKFGKSSKDTSAFENVEYVRYNPENGKYTIPNVFSPGNNNYFTVFALENTTIYIRELKIWNRWGSVIFLDNVLGYWDGTVKGNLAPQDVYIYRVVIQFEDGSIYALRGEVTLLR